MQVLGTAVLAILYPIGNPFYSLGLMLFEAGVLLCAGCLYSEQAWSKKLLLGAVLAGIGFQVYGLYAPEEYAGTVIICGIGLVCAGAAGIAGQEACYFKYREGWIVMFLLPLLVLANLFGKENSVLNAIGFSVLFIALLLLTGKKLRQPLAAQPITACSTTSCKPTNSP
jgi:uncharacterized integral membrane protein